MVVEEEEAGSQSYIAGWNDVAQGTHSGTDPPSAGGVSASNYCNQAISNGDASGWNTSEFTQGCIDAVNAWEAAYQSNGYNTSIPNK